VLDQIEDKLELSFRELGRQNLKNISKPIGEPAELSHAPRLSTDDLSTLRRAALQGIGAVLIPHLLVANDLASGALVRLLPSLKAHTGIVHAVFPSRRGMIPAVCARASRGAETVRLLPS
jgi:DNA-binding transcriptional LysR family regulator